MKLNTLLLEGEDRIVSKWGTYRDGEQLLATVRFDWPLDQEGRHHSYLVLEEDGQVPGYFYVSGVGTSPDKQRQGYGSDLLRYALRELQARGYKGIISYRGGRSEPADALWDKLKVRHTPGYDVLEAARH